MSAWREKETEAFGSIGRPALPSNEKKKTSRRRHVFERRGSFPPSPLVSFPRSRLSPLHGKRELRSFSMSTLLRRRTIASTRKTNHVQELVVVLKEVDAFVAAAAFAVLPQVRQQGAGRLLDLRLGEAVHRVGVCGDGHLLLRGSTRGRQQERGEREREM